MARFCDGPHVAHASWRTKVPANSIGQTTRAWCDECKAVELADSNTKFKAADFEPINQQPVDRKAIDL